MAAQPPLTKIEEVDWWRPDRPYPDAVWRVPSERMKLEFGLREDD